jgi:hypothetical protein
MLMTNIKCGYLNFMNCITCLGQISHLVVMLYFSILIYVYNLGLLYEESSNGLRISSNISHAMSSYKVMNLDYRTHHEIGIVVSTSQKANQS